MFVYVHVQEHTHMCHKWRSEVNLQELTHSGDQFQAVKEDHKRFYPLSRLIAPRLIFSMGM